MYVCITCMNTTFPVTVSPVPLPQTIPLPSLWPPRIAGMLSNESCQVFESQFASNAKMSASESNPEAVSALFVESFPAKRPPASSL